jgi:hypothetical protein
MWAVCGNVSWLWRCGADCGSVELIVTVCIWLWQSELIVAVWSDCDTVELIVTVCSWLWQCGKKLQPCNETAEAAAINVTEKNIARRTGHVKTSHIFLVKVSWQTFGQSSATRTKKNIRAKFPPRESWAYFTAICFTVNFTLLKMNRKGTNTWFDFGFVATSNFD